MEFQLARGFSRPGRSPFQPVNVARDHGTDIQEVSGSESRSAGCTVSQPSGSAIERGLPLRTIQRNVPQTPQHAAMKKTLRSTCS
jgi:hypothetical protein